MSSPHDAFSRQKVEEYRRRAENARARAGKMTDPNRRRVMLEVANTWERMAKWEEEHPSPLLMGQQRVSPRRGGSP